MPAQRKSARLKKWRGKWYVFWTDYTKYPPVERRVSCGGKGTKTKTPTAACKAKLKTYLNMEKREDVAAQSRGGGAEYETPLLKALDRYLDQCDKRVKVRESNPDARSDGMATKTRLKVRQTLGRFKQWLKDTGRGGLTTGALTGNVIVEYRLQYAAGPRSPATIAGEVRYLRVALRWLDELAPPLFRDFAKNIAPKLKPGKGRGLKGLAFTPKQITTFLKTALEREDPDFKSNVKRIIRKGARKGRVQNFKQAPAKASAVPVSRLFILLALTGMRLGEALQLKWDDVDLERGRITIHAQKTGMERILPLTGAPEGDVAPLLAALLRHWNMQKGDREYVLPHDGLDAPMFPKSAWQLTNIDANLPRIGPQMLRKNFTSYAASLHFPASVAAIWQGHSVDVASEYYRQQVLDRQQAPDLEGAMGLGKIIEPLVPAGLLSKVPEAV